MEAELQEEMMMREDRRMVHQREERILQDETYTSRLISSMARDNDNYYCDREGDSQAPPDLEPVTPQPTDMVGQEDCYEPSADELIDVLKNLENLAASNPGLYKSIVSQIKATTEQEEATLNYIENTSNYVPTLAESQQYAEEQAYYEQQLQQQQQQQQLFQQETQFYQEEEHLMNGDSNHMYESNELTQQEMYQREQEIYQEQQQYEESSEMNHMNGVNQEIIETEEERNKRLKMERLEREANEEVRIALQKQREMKMAKLQAAEPPKPKEITVIAGDGKQVKIVLGGEPNTEDSRKQVAEAAGLKHVPLPDFDGAAWAGSLKKTDRQQQQGSKQEDVGGSPWAGSLRHVKERAKKSSKKEDNDLYGAAPWMGTLRHVVHDNKVTKNFGVNQFQSKRYPDEDATNPFEGQGGIHARPAYPLSPAAIINGCAMSRDAMARKEEEEEVQRIRGNIKSSETVSSALLKVLMPKLLKMHETKYPAIDRDEASKIMEEILSMQVGLNVDQQADANEEADMIIRAIMQDEVGKHVYSKMADDLEAAAQRRRKELKKKKVKKTKPAPSTVQSAA
ncbi:uncharacterized protein LOC111705534 [Eurytemora carolleeae]|uniref:uncharacterized protein LOC111705534 n=1 Tax=Eurytemora carolleeae TaxID=1294199 RepID=UPI000C783AC0|nr:uncharacterized protein LOC111705534 [Eurytemora carolleeae]|eukprot:XP_023333885.1 uncharacterized protein LOC111705534 [Eurytemora affinis]